MAGTQKRSKACDDGDPGWSCDCHSARLYELGGDDISDLDLLSAMEASR